MCVYIFIYPQEFAFLIFCLPIDRSLCLFHSFCSPHKMHEGVCFGFPDIFTLFAYLQKLSEEKDQYKSIRWVDRIGFM